MLALQYSIHLPHDTEDQVIENRVSKRAPVFEEVNGMVHKAFLYNRADKLYAPFYVWQDLTGARDFLFDELFQGFVNEFRRPRMRSWIVLEQSHGKLPMPPSYARCESDLVSSEENLEELVAREREFHQKRLENETLYYRLTAINPDRWELLQYSLWKDAASAPPAEADCVQEFEVLHLNEPLKERQAA